LTCVALKIYTNNTGNVSRWFRSKYENFRFGSISLISHQHFHLNFTAVSQKMKNALLYRTLHRDVFFSCVLRSLSLNILGGGLVINRFQWQYFKQRSIENSPSHFFGLEFLEERQKLHRMLYLMSDSTARKRSASGNSGNFMEAVFQAGKFSDFSVVFRPNSCSFLWKTARSRRNNSTIIRAGVLLLFSIDFRDFSAGNGDFS